MDTAVPVGKHAVDEIGTARRRPTLAGPASTSGAEASPADRSQCRHDGEKVPEAEGAQDEDTLRQGHEPSTDGVTTSSRTSQPAG